MNHQSPEIWPAAPLAAPNSPAELTLMRAGMEWAARTNWFTPTLPFSASVPPEEPAGGGIERSEERPASDAP